MAPPGAAARRPLVQELGSFMIFVKHLTGETSMLDVEASDTIASVKLQDGITEQHGLQAGPMQLTDGRTLGYSTTTYRRRPLCTSLRLLRPCRSS